MTPKTAIILLIVMSVVSGIFLSYLFFSTKPANKASDFFQSQTFDNSKETKKEAPVVPTQPAKKAEILNKLEKFRESIASSSVNGTTISSSTANNNVSEKDALIEVRQQQILSELEKFRNSIKKNQ